MSEIDYQKIYKALYVLNKSAKKSRDTANKTDSDGVAKRSRNRKNEIYKLKHATMDKLLEEGKLTFEGLHFQESKDSTSEDIHGFYLAYFKSPEGFSYHRPATNAEVKALHEKRLEEMTVVPAFVKHKENLISYTEAVQVCLDYLNINKDQIKYLQKRSVIKN